MDVISFCFIRKERISLNKRRKLTTSLCLLLLLSIEVPFCFIKVPKYQEEQRIKMQRQEQQYLKELRTTPYIVNQTNVVLNPIGLHDEPMIEVQTLTKTEEVKEVDPPKYTDPDLILLAQLIEAEGGTESYQCKLYIGSVVLNRMISDNHPDGLSDVIFEEAPCTQFSVTIPDKNGNRPIDCIPSEDSLDAAAELLTYGTQLPKEVLVFYSESCDTGWVVNRKTYTQVDHTIFAYAHSK